MVKKILTWGLVALLVFMVAYRPGVAADMVKALLRTVVDIAEGFGDFFSRLVA